MIYSPHKTFTSLGLSGHANFLKAISMSLRGDGHINNWLKAKGLRKTSGAFEWPKAFGLRGLMP